MNIDTDTLDEILKNARRGIVPTRDETEMLVALARKADDIQGEPVAAWVPCSPEWIAAGGDCANAPRIWSEELKNHLHPTAPAPDGAVEALTSEMRLLLEQVKQDFAAAHAEIARLQGLDPATVMWPAWSSVRHTLDWIETVLEESALSSPALPGVGGVADKEETERILREQLADDARRLTPSLRPKP